MENYDAKMSDQNNPGAGPLSLPTGAALAAHRATFVKIHEAAAVYGLSRTRLDHLIQGKEVITLTIGLIYHLATHYPEAVAHPVTIEEYLAALARWGVTQLQEAAWLIGKQYRTLGRYRRDITPSPLVSQLMTHMLRCLAHHPVDEIQAVVADVYAHPLPASQLQALKATWRPADLQALLGLDGSHFNALCQRDTLPPSVAIFVRLVERYPGLIPPAPTQQAVAFKALMTEHGVTSNAAISRLLGRVRQVFQGYLHHDIQPSGPVLALMKLISRFLDTHPLSEYAALVEAVTATPPLNLKTLRPPAGQRRVRLRPRGWWILRDPAVHFIRDKDIVVPDLAGWRCERLPSVPDDPRIELAPDWVCEKLSRTAANKNRALKLALYGRYLVPYVWLVSPEGPTLEAFILRNGRYLPFATVHGDETVSLEPFDDLRFSIADWVV